MFHTNQVLAENSPASDPLYDEFEGVELAQALLRDGKVEATKAALQRVSPSESATKAAQIGKIKGEIALLEGAPARASTQFNDALRAPGADLVRAELELGLARAYHRLDKTTDCAAAATRAGTLATRNESDLLMKAACERGSGNNVAAWRTLGEGRILGRGFGPLLEHVRLMLSMKLTAEAQALVLNHLAQKLTTPSEALALAEALQESGARESALLALETARLRFPTDQDILLAIAPQYFAKGWKRATAEAFTLAAVRAPEYAEHAAETLRQAGSRQRSRYWNMYIPGEKERGRQKLALAVENSRWDLVASMDSLVKRTALDNDDEVSYALAFSLLRSGDRERARSYLEKVRSPGLLAKVSALFKSLEECTKLSWRCL